MMLVNIINLANEAFQGCRHAMVGSEALLALLIPLLDEGREKKQLVIEVP